MKRLLPVGLCLSLALGAVHLSAQTRAVAGPLRLHQVRTIYLGDMGPGDSAGRFRFLLEEQLLQKGFVLTENPDRADALLVGALSVPEFKGESEARVTLVLKTLDGDRVWAGNFGPKLSTILRFKDPLKIRAEQVAERLRKDWEKSQRGESAKS